MNINQAILQKFEDYASQTALEYTLNNDVVTLTYRALKAKVLSVVNYLVGIEAQDRTLIWSKNRVEWVWSHLGVLLSGGINSSLPPDIAPESAIHILKDLNPKFIFLENQAQLDLVTSIKDQLPALERVFVFDEVTQQGDWIAPFSWMFDFKTRPDAVGMIHQMAEHLQLEDTAAILYTKGRTGMPKGAMLSHQNILSAVADLETQFKDYLPKMKRHLCVSYLSLAMTTVSDLYFTLFTGRRLILSETNSFGTDLKASNPSCIIATPAYYGQIHDQILALFDKKKKFNSALSICKEVLALEDKQMQPPAILRIKHNLAKKFILERIKKGFGDQLVFLACGNASLPDHTNAFIRACGINLVNVYSLTETCGIASCSMPSEKNMAAAKPLPNLEFRISQDGLLEVTGPSVFKGYWNNPSHSSAAFTADGYFKTGDPAEITQAGRVRLHAHSYSK